MEVFGLCLRLLIWIKYNYKLRYRRHIPPNQFKRFSAKITKNITPMLKKNEIKIADSSSIKETLRFTIVRVSRFWLSCKLEIQLNLSE